MSARQPPRGQRFGQAGAGLDQVGTRLSEQPLSQAQVLAQELAVPCGPGPVPAPGQVDGGLVPARARTLDLGRGRLEHPQRVIAQLRELAGVDGLQRRVVRRVGAPAEEQDAFQRCDPESSDS